MNEKLLNFLPKMDSPVEEVFNLRDALTGRPRMLLVPSLFTSKPSTCKDWIFIKQWSNPLEILEINHRASFTGRITAKPCLPAVSLT